MINFLKGIFTDELIPGGIYKSEHRHLKDLWDRNPGLVGAYCLKLIEDHNKPRNTIITISTGKFV